jgi:hypothetical protein
MDSTDLVIIFLAATMSGIIITAIMSARLRAASAYLTIDQLVAKIKGPNGDACRRILQENRALFQQVQGSSHNHQFWPGGYIDHVTDAMNIAVVLYDSFSRLRPLPFSLSDALLVVFLHDIEKPWKYEVKLDGRLDYLESLKDKERCHRFRAAKLAEYGIKLTPDQENGMKYVEGEFEDYSNRRRVQEPLAAFCHLCDVTSARLWFDCPRDQDDPWSGARRFRT